MRFSPTGFTAMFKQKYASDDTRTFLAHKPVQAWHPETGEPMVFHGPSSKIVPARTLPGFAGVSEDDAATIAGAFPSPGWTLHGRKTETGETWSRPILGFAVDTDGYGYPMTLEEDALVSVEPEEAPGTEREIVAPGERPSWETPA